MTIKKKGVWLLKRGVCVAVPKTENRKIEED